MAELPEREQACPTFDTLYTLAKKLEAAPREKSDSVSCVGHLAILPKAAPTARHLGDGTMSRQIQRGRGKQPACHGVSEYLT